jgi:RNA polymerase sigma-70 factor (ECF subfamily)
MDINNTITRILEGNTNEYELIMKRFNYEIFSFVFNMVGTYHDTEDIVQDIFIKVYNNLKKFNPEKASFRTWLYKIASNHTINILKKQSRITVTLDDEFNEIEDEENIYNDVLKEEKIKEVVFVMNRVLSPKQLQIMQLHFFSDLTANEISESLNFPIKTVYRIIQTSIEKIKQEVTIDGQNES